MEKAPDATHLVMPVLQRTASLLQAIPTVSWILSPAWLRQSKEKSEFERELLNLYQSLKLSVC